jgi:hypothetical protein
MYFVGQADVYEADFNAEQQARERLAGEWEYLYVLCGSGGCVPSGLQR